jgi:hypothetical protein
MVCVCDESQYARISGERDSQNLYNVTKLVMYKLESEAIILKL